MQEGALGSGDSRRWAHGAGRGCLTVRPLPVRVAREAGRPGKAFCIASCFLLVFCNLRAGLAGAVGEGQPGTEKMARQDRCYPGPPHVPYRASVFL